MTTDNTLALTATTDGDTDTQYRIYKVDDYNYELQSKAKDEDDAAFDKVSDIVIPEYDDSTVTADITALKNLVGTTAVATQISTAIAALSTVYDAKGSAAAVEGKLNTEIGKIKDGTTIDSFADVETELAKKQAAGDYATKAEAQGYANAKDGAIATAQKAADDAQADVDALAEKVGDVDDGTTIVEMIEAAKTEASYDDTEVRGLINTLIGEDTDSSARDIAIKVLTETLVPENAQEAYDTLEEMSAWIQSHPDDATAMNEAITALQTLTGGFGNKTIYDYITQTYYNKTDIDTNYYDKTEMSQYYYNKTQTDMLFDNLAPIAETGNIDDLVQTENTYVIFDCGSSTKNI